MIEDKDDTCWVYIFSRVNDEDNKPCAPVKVGITRNFDSRLATIQTACPFLITDFWVFECPNREWAADLERCFHETQAKARLHGEWFDYHPIVALQLLCMAYRTLADARIKDEKLREWGLDRAGVFWAEKRFGLEVV